MKPPSSFLPRLLTALPLITAIVFHAIALDRWAMAIPALIGIAIYVARAWGITNTSQKTYVAGGIGLITGLVIPVSNVTSGVLPDVAVAVSASVLICIAMLNVFTRKMSVTWISAWAIVALSASVPMTRMVSISLNVFLLTSCLVAAWQIGIFRANFRAIVELGFLLIVVGLSTLGIAAVARRVDTVMLMSTHAMTINNSAPSATGLSENMTVRSQDSIRLSERPVLDLSSMSGYLRIKVLDEFDGRTWSTSARLAGRSHSFNLLDDLPGKSTEPQQSLEIVFLSDLGDLLPAPAGTRRIEHATARISGGWILRGAPETISVVMISDEAGQLPAEAAPTTDDLAIPNDLRRDLGPIAQRLTAAVETNVAKASEIEAFFHRHFEYSLQTNLNGDLHPLVIMVQERRPAYCVYFASAMTVMLRSQGVPARVVSGYAPSEVNRLTGRVIVRDRDAHAWVEAWSPEQNRYIAFDPTPTASRLETIGHPEQSSVVAAVIAAARSLVQRLYLAATKQPLRLLGTLLAAPWFWLVVAVSLLVMGKRYLTRIAVAAGVQRDAVDPELRELYNEYVRSLQLAGITPQAWETNEEVIARIVGCETHSLSDAARDFIARYQASRFGGAELDEQLRLARNSFRSAGATKS